MRTDWFALGKFAKLKPRPDGPFKVQEKVGKNVYKIDLHEEYDVWRTFNVADFSSYHEEVVESDWRSSKPGEIDTRVIWFSWLDMKLEEFQMVTLLEILLKLRWKIRMQGYAHLKAYGVKVSMHFTMLNLEFSTRSYNLFNLSWSSLYLLRVLLLFPCFG